MKSFEQLGAFYLGRTVDPASGETGPEPLLYDAKDLTTHAVVVGMTGSGKTGLGVGLIEEALIDGIPVLAIDPKGDLGNLLLAFPRLRPEDFRPWIDPAQAARRGRSVDEEARATAALWRSGLAEWGQEPARIQRYRDAAEPTLYTPGGTAGRGLRVLRSLAAPPPALRDDSEAFRERLAGAASGLLGLLGLAADPLQSREHILLSSLLAHAWEQGRDVNLPELIRQIQRPPLERLGVMDLETFYPAAERQALALSLNGLLASPGFAAWTEGDPLDVGALLWTPEGRPRLSVLSIAHLSDRERMFFVTLLLSELLAWMRSQPGSGSLRALLYMDEVAGYLPPVANPSSKAPMLTLLKQARAFGVGLVLATQNPVDLDYKALSNAGTWFVGRLQTERDKARLLDGLEGASAAAFDRAETERILSGLPSRTFLLNNVHEDRPVLFQTRWVLSYLAGPLARDQIRQLAAQASGPATEPPPSPAVAPPAKRAAAPSQRVSERPSLPADCEERFAPVVALPGPGESLLYRPALLGAATLHHVDARAGLDAWSEVSWLADLEPDLRGSPWRDAPALDAIPELDAEPEPGVPAGFDDLPSSALRAATWPRWRKMLASHAYRERALTLWSCRKPRLAGRPGEREGAFRARLAAAQREARDVALEKLRARYAPKLARLRDQIERAEQRVEREREQYDTRKLQTAVSVGRTVLGALFGRKLGSVGTVSRAGTAIDRATRAARERGDIARAEERLETLSARLEALEADFEQDLAPLQAPIDPSELEVRARRVSPRKGDLEVAPLWLVWLPWRVDTRGVALPAHGLARA